MIRHICTEENPWTPDKGAVMHPDAKYLRDNEDCSIEHYECPYCGTYFEVELPQ